MAKCGAVGCRSDAKFLLMPLSLLTCGRHLHERIKFLFECTDTATVEVTQV